MKKSFLLLVPAAGISYCATAQQLSPELVSSAGGSATAAGVVLDWSLGEVAVETVSTATTLYTQGFHQPTLQVVALARAPDAAPGPLFSAAPNPVESVLTVFMPANLPEEVQLSLTDASGRLLTTQLSLPHQAQQQLSLVDLAAGLYFLSVRNKDGKSLQTFKIIKVQ